MPRTSAVSYSPFSIFESVCSPRDSALLASSTKSAPYFAASALKPFRVSTYASREETTNLPPFETSNRDFILATASSNPDGICSPPILTCIREILRGEFTICANANFPSAHIAFSFLSDSIFAPIILPCLIFSISLQWLGHKVQTLSASESWTPNHLPHLSVRQPVGHSSTQVPQKRHSSELQVFSNATEIFAFLPRLAMLIAGLSCIFSQVLKHLPQSMQRLWSLSINGSSRSILSIEYNSGRSMSRVKLPIATPRNSHPGLLEQAPQRVAIPALVGVDFSISQSSRESQLNTAKDARSS